MNSQDFNDDFGFIEFDAGLFQDNSATANPDELQEESATANPSELQEDVSTMNPGLFQQNPSTMHQGVLLQNPSTVPTIGTAYDPNMYPNINVAPQAPDFNNHQGAWQMPAYNGAHHAPTNGSHQQHYSPQYYTPPGRLPVAQMDHMTPTSGHYPSQLDRIETQLLQLSTQQTAIQNTVNENSVTMNNMDRNIRLDLNLVANQLHSVDLKVDKLKGSTRRGKKPSNDKQPQQGPWFMKRPDREGGSGGAASHV